MKYKISTKCCWFRGGSMIVKMYFINGMPFTFDELPDGHLRDADLIKEADESRTFMMQICINIILISLKKNYILVCSMWT